MLTRNIQNIETEAIDEKEGLPENDDLLEVDTMLAEKVKKWTRPWVKEGLREGIHRGRREGLELGTQRSIGQGMEKGLIQTAMNMLEKNMEFDVIAELTGLSIGKVEDLSKYDDLLEMETMFAEKVKYWAKAWEEEGLREGIQRGLREGIKQGIEQALIQTAENMLDKGMKHEVIAKLTGLSIGKVRDIAEHDGLLEIYNMLTGDAKEWAQAWKDEGLRRGIQRGRREGMERGTQRGIEQGIEKSLIQTAINMLEKNMELEIIVELTGLSIDKVKYISENSDKYTTILE